MDNASIHKTNTTQSIIEQDGCKLLFLPPYSPDLNPIEHLWANIKENFPISYIISLPFRMLYVSTFHRRNAILVLSPDQYLNFRILFSICNTYDLISLLLDILLIDLSMFIISSSASL